MAVFLQCIYTNDFIAPVCSDCSLQQTSGPIIWSARLHGKHSLKMVDKDVLLVVDSTGC